MAEGFLSNVNEKNAVLKQRILSLCIADGDYSISDFSKELDSSIPTITKLVSELIEAGYLKDLGKAGISSGRRPSIYGLNPDAGYIVGMDVRRYHISVAVTDFKGKIVDSQSDIPFALTNTVESFHDLCNFILKHITKLGIKKEQVLSYGLNLTGRVNHVTGYSYSYFIGEDKPIAATMESFLERPVYIENDSRAMCFGEYRAGIGKNEQNIICQCGKVGCLETEASGSALHREFIEKLAAGRASILSEKYRKGDEITIEDITDALADEDMLAIECIEHVGKTLGKALAGLKSAINKYSLNMVSKDSRIEMSKLGKNAGPIGACMLSRSRLLGLM